MSWPAMGKILRGQHRLLDRRLDYGITFGKVLKLMRMQHEVGTKSISFLFYFNNAGGHLFTQKKYGFYITANIQQIPNRINILF